jgi:hypothetical protein
LEVTVEESIGEVLVSILVQFQIGEFEYTGENLLHNEPINLSELPLMEKAREWGLTVKIVPGLRICLGHYDKERREILLASLDVKAWFHELAHVAIERLRGSITPAQLQWEEIMAELTAVALHELVLKKPDERLSDSYSHIFLNAVVLDKSPVEACLEVFSETEQIIRSILE